ncbi:MAG: PQQ-binding-like beta-propeller repeat protein [Spirochaetes bacterium]|nr:PQQ-binding-like beta-propeller repeat protein [Spirochaetota bacterium]
MGGVYAVKYYVIIIVVFFSVFFYAFGDQNHKVTTGIRWQSAADGRIIYKPAIDYSKVIYVVTDSKRLYAVNPDGILSWSRQLKGMPAAPPVIGFDNSIIVPLNTKEIYSYKPNGSIRWVFKSDRKITGNLAIGNTGNIYFPCGSVLYSIDYRGRLIWRYGLAGRITAGPVADINGSVYAGTDNGRFYAVKGNGGKLWKLRIPGTVSLVIAGKQGRIYIGSSGITSADRGGFVLWNYNFPGRVRGILESNDGSIVTATRKGKFYRISASGKKQVEFDSGIKIKSLSVLTENGNVLFISEKGILYSVYMRKNSLKQRAVKEFYGRQGEISGIALSADGIVYAGSADWILTALETGYKQGKGNVWSAILHDASNTSRQNALADKENGVYYSISERAFSDSRKMKMSALDSIEDSLRYKTFLPLYADKEESILSFLSSESVLNRERLLGNIINNFPEVRARSDLLLGLLGTEKARQILVNLLVYEQNEDVKVSCIKAIGNIGMDPEGSSEKMLAGILRKNKNNERIVLNVIKSLKKVGIINRGFKKSSTYSILINFGSAGSSTAVQKAAEDTLRSIIKIGEEK